MGNTIYFYLIDLIFESLFLKETITHNRGLQWVKGEKTSRTKNVFNFVSNLDFKSLALLPVFWWPCCFSCFLSLPTQNKCRFSELSTNFYWKNATPREPLKRYYCVRWITIVPSLDTPDRHDPPSHIPRGEIGRDRNPRVGPRCIMPAGTRGGGQCGRRSGRKRRMRGARVLSEIGK